jgi:hypothetical protein
MPPKKRALNSPEPLDWIRFDIRDNPILNCMS